MWKKATNIIGALVIIGGLISGYIWFDATYAKAADTEKNSLEIRINQTKNDVRWYQDQMVYIMSRCGKRNPNELPAHAYQNYESYRIKKEELENELTILMNKR